MSEDNKDVKVYTALKDFELDGQAYTAGEKYEISAELAMTLEEGTVEEFVVPDEETTPETTPDGASETGADGASAGENEEEKKEVTPAKPWVGNHTVGRE